MTIEVACPTCDGRLRAEPGTVVACPHCQSHLQVPADPAAAATPTTEDETLDLPAATAAPARRRRDDSLFPDLPGVASISDLNMPLISGSSIDELEPTEALTGVEVRDFGALDDGNDASAGGDSIGESPTVVATGSLDASLPPAADGNGVRPVGSDGSEPAARSAAPDAGGGEKWKRASQLPYATPSSSPIADEAPNALPKPDRTGSRLPAGVPRHWFVIACSYSVAVTLVLILLLTRVLRPNQLESLPDIVPKHDARGNIEVGLYPEDAVLPQGHIMRLGDGPRRFGNLAVQPLRVTREPLEFVHFEDQETIRSPVGPVLKLWLTVRNASREQTFVPLGRMLVFKRGRSDLEGPERANNFVCQVGSESRRQNHVLIYALSTRSEFLLKEQQVDRALAPGEELTTYIPSMEEGIDELEGELVWRVHLRKGLGPSGWGVTTLIDVRFHSDEIIDESELIAGP